MTRKLLFLVGFILMVLLICEIIGLFMLYTGVNRYRDYWQGRANQPGEFLYVALGDSAAQGAGASQPENGYVGLIAAHIEQQTGRKVRVINLSVHGAKLADALRVQTPKLSEYDADLVTIEIGANDMGTYNPTEFASRYDKILQSLPPGRSVVSNMPYFGTRPHLNSKARDANEIIRQRADFYRIPVADLYGDLSTAQSPLIYSSDFFHPNNRGYRIWYNAFRDPVDQVISN